MQDFPQNYDYRDLSSAFLRDAFPSQEPYDFFIEIGQYASPNDEISGRGEWLQEYACYVSPGKDGDSSIDPFVEVVRIIRTRDSNIPRRMQNNDITSNSDQKDMIGYLSDISLKLEHVIFS